MAEITDVIGGEDDFVPPHKVKGAAAERFAELSSTAQEPDPDEVPDASVIGDRLARQEALAADVEREEVARIDEEEAASLAAIDFANAETAAEAEGAIGVRYTEVDDLAQQVWRGQLDAEGQPPEVLAAVDALVADHKRREEAGWKHQRTGHGSKSIAGTMTPDTRDEWFTEKIAETAQEAATAVGDALITEDILGIETQEGWMKNISLQTNDRVHADATFFDAFYEDLINEDKFDEMGMLHPLVLENTLKEKVAALLAELPEDKNMTPYQQRIAVMDQLTRGAAIRNDMGHIVNGMKTPEGLYDKFGSIEDLAHGISMYRSKRTGSLPTNRYNAQGEQIPFTEREQKQIEERLRTHGVYDPFVPSSPYRVGSDLQDRRNGLTSWHDPISQTVNVMADLAGLGRDVRQPDMLPMMAGYVSDVIITSVGVNKATGLTKLANLQKSYKRTKKLSAYVMAYGIGDKVADHYMTGTGQGFNTLEGVLRELPLEDVLAMPKEAFGANLNTILNPVIEMVYDYALARPDLGVTEWDSTAERRMKHLASGIRITNRVAPAMVILGAALALVIKGGKTLATQSGRAYIKEAGKVLVKEGVGKAGDLEKAVKAIAENIDLGSERGAVGGGRLPQFGRGADEGATRAGQEGLLDDMDHWYNRGDEARRKANRAELESILSKISQEDPAMRFDIGGQKNFDAEVTNRDILEDLKGLASNDDLTYESGWSSLTRDELENFASSIHGDDVSHAFMLSGDDFAKEVSDADIVSFIKENLKGLDKPKAPATRAGQEGFLNLDPIKMLKGLRDRLSKIRNKKGVDKKVVDKDISELDEEIEAVTKDYDSEGRPRGHHREDRSEEYNAFEQIQRAIKQREQSKAFKAEVEGVKPKNGEFNKSQLSDLQKKARAWNKNVDADLEHEPIVIDGRTAEELKADLLNRYASQIGASNAGIRSARAAAKEMHPEVNFDDWGTAKGGGKRYDKATGEGVTLEEFLEARGVNTKSAYEGSEREVVDKIKVLREELDIEEGTSIDELIKEADELGESTGKLELLKDLEARAGEISIRKKQDRAIRNLIEAMEKYRDVSEGDRALVGGELEYYFMKAQKMLTEGIELDDLPIAAQSTRTQRLPDLEDASAMNRFVDTNIKSGNYDAGYIMKRLEHFRTSPLAKDIKNAGRTDKKAIDALRKVLVGDKRFKNARTHSQTHSASAFLQNTRSWWVSKLIGAPATQVVASQGATQVLPREAIRRATDKFLSKVPFIKNTRWGRQAEFAETLARKSSPHGDSIPDRVLPRVDKEGEPIGQEAYRSWLERVGRVDRNGWSFWKRLKHRVFSAIPLPNMRGTGTDWAGEYDAGFSGTIKVLGDEVDIEGASVMGRSSVTSFEKKWARYTHTLLGAFASFLPRNVMQPMDATIKKAFYMPEFRRQLADKVFRSADAIPSRTAKGTPTDAHLWSDVSDIVRDFRLAVADGQLKESELDAYIRANYRKMVEANEGVGIAGYTEDQVVAVTKSSYDSTMDVQRQMTMQQELPRFAKPLEQASQHSTIGFKLPFMKTLVNNWAMFAERVPAFGILFDYKFGSMAGKGKLTPLQWQKIIQKQGVGVGYYVVGKMLVDSEYGKENIKMSDDGDIIIETNNVSEEDIRSLLLSSWTDDPEILEDMMESYNQVYNPTDADGNPAPFTNATEWFMEEGIYKYMPTLKDGKGRAYIKAPRLGWMSSLLYSSIAFNKSMKSFDYLPVSYIKENGVMDRLVDGISGIGFGGGVVVGTATGGGADVGDVVAGGSSVISKGRRWLGEVVGSAPNVIKQGGAHELGESLATIASLLHADSAANVSDVVDLIARDMASIMDFQGSTLSTSGELFEQESELSRDRKAVSGWEEFMESGNLLSIPRILNSIYGDEHVSRRRDGMGFPVTRVQRDFDPRKGLAMVEWDYILHDSQDMLDLAQVTVKPMLDNQVISGQDRGIHLYNYKSKGVTAYEEIVSDMHKIVIPIKEHGIVVARHNYETALNAFFGGAGKELQEIIDAGMARGQEIVAAGGDPFEGGRVSDREILAAMAAKEIYHTKIVGIRKVFKNLSVARFKADGKTKLFKADGRSLNDVLVGSKVAEVSGALGLIDHFELEHDLSSMGTEELEGYISDAVEREYEYLLEALGANR